MRRGRVGSIQRNGQRSTRPINVVAGNRVGKSLHVIPKPTPISLPCDMPDLTISVEQNLKLAPALQEIGPLKPPPKARYVLGKASDSSLPPYEAYSKAEQKLVQRVAVQDKDGNPILRALGNGQAHFDVQKELQEEYDTEMKELKSGDVILKNVRCITRAELGQCPITVDQERILVQVGLLEDSEPA